MKFRVTSASTPNTGCGGRIGVVLFGLFFGTMGLVFMLVPLQGALQQRRMQAWTPTRCVIEAAEVNDVRDEYEFVVRYAYDYAGRRYTGDRYRGQGGERFEDVATKRRLLSQYKVGAETQCYVDPGNPSRAMLVRAGSILPYLGGALFASIFVLIGYGMVVAACRPRKAGPVSATGGSSAGRNGLRGAVLFCSLFIAIGSVVPYFTFVRPYLRQEAAKAWTPVEATVEKSMVKSHSGDDSTTYSVYIAYRYTFGGETHEGDRYNFAGGSSSGRGAKEAVVQRHPVGSTVTVYVDPDAPHESVILRNAGAALYLGLIPVVFAVFGVLFLVLVRRQTARAVPGAATSGAFAATKRRQRPSAPAVKRAGSRAGRFFGITFAALFWNGIVSVFLFHVAHEWQRGHRPIFLTLFLVPFVLIGVALIWGIVYEFLRLFNPRFELEAPPTALVPGASAHCGFHVIGNVRKLVDLKVWLVGREEATYQRGTNSCTDKHEFLKRLVFETQDFRRMELGTLDIAIPEGAMHSFTATHNKIVWSLKVEGGIPRWPDLAEEFIVNVVPKEERA
jgi:hypothetical protein